MPVFELATILTLPDDVCEIQTICPVRPALMVGYWKGEMFPGHRQPRGFLMDSVPQDVTRLLGPTEQVQLYIKQKIYHPKLKVDSVVLTNHRIILRHPRILGLEKDFTDFSYMDVANAVLDKGMLRSTIKCILRFGGDPLALEDLPNSDAEKAYGIIRENLSRFQAPLAMGYPNMAAAVYASPGIAGGGTCRKCGQRLGPGARFCGSCGSPL